MERDRIKELLINMITPENESIIMNTLKSIDKLSDEDLKSILEELNITEDNLKQYIDKLVERKKSQESSSKDFIKVNEMFCYGRTGNTIHIHLIPEDLRELKKKLGDEAFYRFYKEQLEDFLAKLQEVFKEDITIDSLFAVSPIFFNPEITAAHESLGFDTITEIDPNNESDNMSLEQKENFINMFNKDGTHKKKVYYTRMVREKFLGMKYSELPEEKQNLI